MLLLQTPHGSIPIEQEKQLFKFLKENNFPEERIVRHVNKLVERKEIDKKGDEVEKEDEEENDAEEVDDDDDDEEKEEDDREEEEEGEGEQGEGEQEDEDIHDFQQFEEINTPFQEIWERSVKRVRWKEVNDIRYYHPDDEPKEQEGREEIEDSESGEQFISVWNMEDIKSSKDLKYLFNRFPFGNILRKLNLHSNDKTIPTKKKGSRGNRQFNVGVSSLSMNDTCPITKQKKPQFLNETENWKQCFEMATSIYSKLGYTIPHLVQNNYKAAYRFRQFASQISRFNYWELGTGFVNDGSNPLLSFHVDQLNDHLPSYNNTMIISKLLLKKESEKVYKVVRTGWVSSTRKQCGSFIRRIEASVDIQNTVISWYNSLEETKKTFDPAEFFQFKNIHGLLEKNCGVFPANMDKCIFYSAYVQPLYLLQNKFKLTMPKLLEVAIVIPWTTEPYKFNVILRRWIVAGTLPDGCLAEAYLSESLEEFGCSNSGLFPRFMVSATKPLEKKNVYESLRKLYNLVMDLNNSEEKITMTELAGKIQQAVSKCGDLHSQHLAQVLMMVQILNFKEPSQQAYVSDTTNTADVLKSMGLDESQSRNIFIQSLARKLNLPESTVENIICECFRKTAAYDFYFSGASIYRIEKNQDGNGFTLYEYSPSYTTSRHYRKTKVMEMNYKTKAKQSDNICWMKEEENLKKAGEVTFSTGGRKTDHFCIKFDSIDEASKLKYIDIFLNGKNFGRNVIHNYLLLIGVKDSKKGAVPQERINIEKKRWFQENIKWQMIHFLLTGTFPNHSKKMTRLQRMQSKKTR